MGASHEFTGQNNLFSTLRGPILTYFLSKTAQNKNNAKKKKKHNKEIYQQCLSKCWLTPKYWSTPVENIIFYMLCKFTFCPMLQLYGMFLYQNCVHTRLAKTRSLILISQHRSSPFGAPIGGTYQLIFEMYVDPDILFGLVDAIWRKLLNYYGDVQLRVWQGFKAGWAYQFDEKTPLAPK